MRKKSARWMVSSLLVVSFLAVHTAACSRTREGDSRSEKSSRASLRTALIALDHGDDGSAEQALRESLSQDPLNGRARVVLSSLYAKQAGITLKDWYDPILESAGHINSRLKTYQDSSALIDDIAETLRLASESTKASLSETESRIRDRVEDLTKGAAKFLVGANVVLEVFNNVPFLSEEQLHKLDRAIEVLREEGVPLSRTEENRIYLSVLSLMRLVNHMKRLMGDPNNLNFTVQKEKLCSLDSVALKNHLREVRKSLVYVEEGLVVDPNDPETVQRLSREKMQAFVTRFLNSPYWEKLDDMFDARTYEGSAAKFAVDFFCSEKLRKQAEDKFNGVLSGKESIGKYAQAIEEESDKLQKHLDQKVDAADKKFDQVIGGINQASDAVRDHAQPAKNDPVSENPSEESGQLASPSMTFVPIPSIPPKTIDVPSADRGIQPLSNENPGQSMKDVLESEKDQLAKKKSRSRFLKWLLRDR